MDINTLSIEQLVEYVNKELINGRNMREIENNDFNVNDRVIVKRLNRRGYKRQGNEFKKDITKVILKNKGDENEPMRVLNGGINKNIGNEKIMELVELLEPIKVMLEDYNTNKNIGNTNELRPKAVTEVKQKLFKIDVNVLEQWEKFIAEHKEYKVQQLISLALQEFITKYN